MKQADLAERLSISRPTLRKLERGDPTVSIAVLVQVLDVLGLADQLSHIADPDADALGKALEETRLQRTRVDGPRRTTDMDF
jgi:transcriptional regulator with XRE-family HTH domain